MKRRVRVVIPGEPVGQGRPRTAVINGKARIYSPKNSDSWRGYAATIMKAETEGMLLEGPVRLFVTAVFTLPKSRHKKSPVNRRTPCTKKPDFDNIGKIVADAGNGILWIDDSQIYSAYIFKLYGKQGEAPFVQICAEADAETA